MIKKIAWDAFKNTGDINAFLELKQIENIENNIKEEQKMITFCPQLVADIIDVIADIIQI